MAMNGKEFKDWAANIADNEMVAVDDGGLTIIVNEPNGSWNERNPTRWCEIGGVPLEEA